MTTTSTPCILIADDDLLIRKCLCMALEDTGYALLEAVNGKEALDLLRRSSAPLVTLLDLQMPVMTGFEVLAQVAQDQALATRHRYIANSALPYERAIHIGSQFASHVERLRIPYLTKPFRVDEVTRVVQRAYTALLAAAAAPGSPDSSGGDRTT